MDRDVVARREQLVERQRAGAQITDRRVVEVGVEGDEAHAEAADLAGEHLADPPEADDPDGLVDEAAERRQLVEDGPVAAARRLVEVGHPAGEGEDHRQRVIADLLDGGAGHIGDLDPRAGRGVDVDVVEAGAEAGDHPAAVELFDHLRGQRLADHEEGVGLAAVLDQLLLGRAGALDQLDSVRREGLAVAGSEGEQGAGLQCECHSPDTSIV